MKKKVKKEVKLVHGEIEYVRGDGTKVHSDICPCNCDFSNMDEKYREYLHISLDEWLNESNGTGCFYIEQAEWERT